MIQRRDIIIYHGSMHQIKGRANCGEISECTRFHSAGEIKDRGMLVEAIPVDVEELVPQQHRQQSQSEFNYCRVVLHLLFSLS